MDKSTIKNVSLKDVEAAIAKTLTSISGWEESSVSISSTEFEPPSFRNEEKFSMKLSVVLHPATDPDPFGGMLAIPGKIR